MPSRKTRMTPFRCPNEVYDRVREMMNRVRWPYHIGPISLTDVIVVALNEWCDRVLEQERAQAAPAPIEPMPKKPAKKKSVKEKVQP